MLEQHLHVADVVDEGDFLQQHHEALPVHLDSDHHAVEGELAYGRVSLRPLLSLNKMRPFMLRSVIGRTHLGINNAEVSRCEGHGNEGSREELLNKRDVFFV